MKITQYTNITSPAANDLLPIVDVNDETMAPSGTTKNMTVSQLGTALSPAIFNPIDYGAVGNGTADDTTALQNCATAAMAAHGIIDLGNLTYKTSSSITVGNYFHMRGAGGIGQGGITNSSSAIFTFNASAQYVTFENLSLTASAGHIWSATNGPSLSLLRIWSVYCNQTGNYGIWYQTGGLWIDNLVGGNCIFYTGATTVSPFYFYEMSGSFNSVEFSRMRITFNNTISTVPAIVVDNGSVAGYNQNIIFRSITFEQCNGGCIYVTGCAQVLVEQCIQWDHIPNANTFNFQASAANYNCLNVTLRQSGNNSPNASYYDTLVGSGCINILIDCCGTWGQPMTYSSPVLQTTVLAKPNATNYPTFVTPQLTMTGQEVPCVVTLVDAATTAVNAQLGNDFRWTLTANGHTLGNPTNSVDGQKIIVQVTQPASGGPYTIAYGSNYLFSTGLPSPTLSTAAGYTDLLGFIYNATLGKWLFSAFVNGYA